MVINKRVLGVDRAYSLCSTTYTTPCDVLDRLSQLRLSSLWRRKDVPTHTVSQV